VSKWLRVLVSAALLGVLAWQTDWARVAEALGGLRVEGWLAAAALLLLVQLTSACRWHVLALPLGFERPFRQVAGFYFIGMYFNLVLPTSVGGDVVRAWYLDRRPGRKTVAFASVVLDRLNGLLVLLVLAALGAALSPLPLPGWVHAFVWGAAGGAAVGLALLPALARWQRVPKRPRALLAALASKPAWSPRVLLSATALSLLVQVANVVIVWLLGLAVGAPVPGAYYWVLVPMVSLLTLLPVSVNGMGVREGAMVLFLAPLSVSKEAALTLAFLWFTVTVAVNLSGGLVYLFGRFPAPAGAAAPAGEEPAEHGPVGGDPDQGRARQPPAAA
jgi:uncharacterized membrane protein YbhN (UPF0104 family)